MKVRHFLCLSYLLISQFIPLEAQKATLQSKDVRGVMEELFEYHIDKKEICPLVLERSLKVYIKEFDPSYVYLLQDEVAPYLHPHANALSQMMHDYDQDRFTAYFNLNQKIQDGIIRARGWRQEWFQHPKKLISDAKAFKSHKNKDEKPATSLQELKNRHYQRFVEYVSLQLKDMKDEKLVGNETKLIALCEKQFVTMENEYLGVNDQGKPLQASEQEHQVILRTIKSLAHSLDAHTAYYSPDEAYAMKVQLEKGMCGIGVVLREGIDGIVIQELLEGGPAKASGNILKGDRIVEVDGQNVEGYSFHKVLEIMKGQEGSHTTLGVIRQINHRPQKVRVELVRSKIVLADKRVDVEWEPYGDGILGKITLYSFYEGDDGVSSEQDLKAAIDELKEKGPLHGLVLDMRDNCGGFLSQAVKVGGLFISSGVVVISKYSDGSVKYYRSVDGKRYYDGPLVVLISKGSASATEIVAQALKDYGVAVIVGDEQTYGKGTIQHQTVTSDGNESFFKVTIGRYYTVSGRSTQIEGVKADIVIPSSLHEEEVGEGYLEYPLPSDQVAEAYDDSLHDVDPLARKWFQKYYLPTLQQKVTKWDELLPVLQANSQKRLEQNKNFQTFLKKIKESLEPTETLSYGVNDLQMEEAVNIVKDMIFLSSTPVPVSAP